MAQFRNITSACAENNGGCEHICIDKDDGSYECKCREGFTNMEAICTVLGGSINKNEGFLISPNYPEFYPSMLDVIWIVSVPADHQIKISFIDFELEISKRCSFDSLTITDGVGSNASPLVTLCDSRDVKTIYTTRNQMSIHFISDPGIQRRGYFLHFTKVRDMCADNHGCEHQCIRNDEGYKCMCDAGFELHPDGKRCEKECGGEITAPNGSISSPFYPHFYPNNKTCVWIIQAPDNHFIILNFTHFDLERNSASCEYDSVKIFSTNNTKEDVVTDHGTFCGHDIPLPVISVGNVLKLEFKSDDAIQMTGFRADFITDKDECKKDNGGCEHFCENSVGSYTCTCRQQFILHENKHNCTDIDECASQNGGCQHKCRNTMGNYECECHDGFVLEKDNHTCADDDECALQNGGCQHVCRNVIGSYACFCNYGFTLVGDNHNCTDVDECFINNGGCEDQCKNTLGSYICKCSGELFLHDNKHNCTERDPCLINKGGCQHICISSAGSYTCSCYEGFYLEDNNRSCAIDPFLNTFFQK